MMCTYAFQRCHRFLHLTIQSGNNILDPQVPNNHFLRIFTKNHIFQKSNIVSDSAQQGISIQPIKSAQPYECIIFIHVYERHPMVPGKLNAEVNRRLTRQEAILFILLEWYILHKYTCRVLQDLLVLENTLSHKDTPGKIPLQSI